MQSAVTIALILGVTPDRAAAEVFDPLRGYALDGTPVAPNRGGDRRQATPDAPRREPRAAPSYVSSSTVRRSALRSGFKLLDQPHRHGRTYFATAEDDKGHKFKLIFSAYTGQIVDRTDLGVIEAKAPVPATVPAPKTAEPATQTPVAPTPTAPVAAVAAVPALPAPTVAPPVPVAVAIPAPTIPTPATPPANVAAVNPCEIVPAGAAPKSTAAAAVPANTSPMPTAEPPSVATATVEPPVAPSNQPDTVEPKAAESPVTAAPVETTATTAQEPDAKPSATDSANMNSPPEPYYAPAPDTAEASEVAVPPTIDAPAASTSPSEAPQSPPEPYAAPNWSDVSDSASAPQTNGKP